MYDDELFVLRNEFLQKAVAFKDKHLIKIITGVRRCGKSILMESYRDWLLGHGVPQNHIIFLNFEDYENKPLRNADALYVYVKERIAPEGKTYLFFDEIQRVENFPDVVDGLYIKKNIDLYLTGSNSELLSSEIATLLSGRYVEIKMLPLSFREFVQATKSEGNLQKAYQQYVETSSFPYALNLLSQPKELRDYLEGVFNTIIVKDITQRRKILDTMMLESVTRFVFDTIGLELSTKKIADTMTTNGRKSDPKTVESYLSALKESFIIYQANRYNVKGKEFLKTQEKYYAVDMGLRTLLLGKRAMDVGHILENIIYLELIRRGFDVYVGKVDDKEIDFVAMNDNGNTYIQVAASLRDPVTLERELKPLKMVRDNYPKLLLSLDEDPEGDYDGIRRMNALQWLMAS